MARGGRGRRTSYVRDNSGRFASTPGSGPPKRSTPATRRAAGQQGDAGGTLGARSSVRRSRAKLATKDPADRSLRGSLSLRAQKGAVTRGANRLGKVRAASTVRMAGKGPAGVIRGGRKVAAGPVAAPRSSVRVIRPNRPAMRPGPGPDRGKISEYVGAVRGARRRLSSAKPGTADAAEAKQGLKDNRRALSRRIQRERGARRGLKPATSRQVLTGTVPAPPAGRVKAPRPSGTLAKPRNLKPGAIAARKARIRQPNLKAQRAKAMASRTGVVSGRLRTDGQDTRTLSLKEMRGAVRKALRKGGIETRAQFEKAYGRPPTTRGGWEKLYRENVALPQSERNRKARTGVINGVDIHRNYRPWQVFGLNPKTATRADVESAYRRVAKQVHPDTGGRRRDFERVKKLRDSVLAQMPAPKGGKPAKASGGKRGKAPAPVAPQGVKLLPPRAARLAAAKRMKAARPAGTVVKPRGLKVGAIAGRKANASKPPKQKRSAPRLSFSDTATKRRFNRSGDFALYRYRENQAAVISGDKTAQLKAGRNQFIRFLASNLNRQALKATAAQRKKAYQSIKRFSTISNPQPGGDWKRNRDRAAMDEVKRLKETARQDGIGGKWDPRNRTKRKPRKP